MADLPINHETWNGPEDRKERYAIDHDDTKQLWKFAMDNCEVAEDYAESRKRFGNALRELKLELAKR